MKFFTRNGDPMPQQVLDMVESAKQSDNGVNRREFLAIASCACRWKSAESPIRASLTGARWQRSLAA